MTYEFLKDKVIIKNVTSFNVAETLESGQCFRFNKIDDNSYKIIAHRRALYIEQTIKDDTNEITLHPCTKEEFETIWFHYFDLANDYDKIKEKLSKNDPIMKNAIDYAQGIRLLNQEIWECLVSFIISQRNSIARIKKVIDAICEKYGDEIEGGYAFPTQERVVNIHIDDLLDCKVGYRAKYILDAAKKFLDGEIVLSGNTLQMRESLLKVNGIGNKVADCVLLFSLGAREVFPIDVWIQRIVRESYFNGSEISNTKMAEFAAEHFGEDAGIAQQYLFHCARTSGMPE